MSSASLRDLRGEVSSQAIMGAGLTCVDGRLSVREQHLANGADVPKRGLGAADCSSTAAKLHEDGTLIQGGGKPTS